MKTRNTAVGRTFELGIVDDFLRHAGHFRHLQVAACVTNYLDCLQAYLAQSVYKVVLQNSILTQTRQINLYTRNSKGKVNNFLGQF